MGERQMLPRHTNRTESLGESSAMPMVGDRWIQEYSHKIFIQNRISPRRLSQLTFAIACLYANAEGIHRC